MDKITKNYKTKKNICKLISILLTITPILVYTILALIYGDFGQKATMSICLLTSLIFVAINIVFKHHIRCTIWIMLVGIYIAIDNITPLIIIMAITTMLDEFIFEPLTKYYFNKYSINIEIDKRS